MAPSDTNTNPRKRKQPPFHQPGPRTNSSGVFKSSTSARRANIGSVFNDGAKTSKPRAKPKAKAAEEPVGVREQEPEEDDDDDATERLLDDEAEGDEDESDGDEEEQDEAEDDNDASDADMMLAEVTHDLPENEAMEPAIPIPLLHRLMHHSFKTSQDTKLSTDARACVGKYIEVFIREGIARCAFEVSEKAHEGGSDSALGHDDGWLEVEDLERVGGQLVLDF